MTMTQPRRPLPDHAARPTVRHPARRRGRRGARRAPHRRGRLVRAARAARARGPGRAAPLRATGAPGAGPPPDRRDRRRVRGLRTAGDRARRTPDFASTADAATRLVAAIDRGELDDVDAIARWLGRAATATELRALLSADVVKRLAAAAHAPIFLYQLPRIAPRGEVSGELLRGLARELGRAPDWRLRWFEAAGVTTQSDRAVTATAVFDAIASTPLGTRDAGATPFIYPLMARVDEPGIAADQLARRRRRPTGRRPRPGRAARGRVVDAPRARRPRALRLEPLPDAPAGRPRARPRVGRREHRARDRRDLRGRVPQRARPQPAPARVRSGRPRPAVARGAGRLSGGGGRGGVAPARGEVPRAGRRARDPRVGAARRPPREVHARLSRRGRR